MLRPKGLTLFYKAIILRVVSSRKVSRIWFPEERFQEFTSRQSPSAFWLFDVFAQLSQFKQRFDQERRKLGQALEKSQAASRSLAQIVPNIVALQQQYR
jgi:hypothetical protein